MHVYLTFLNIRYTSIVFEITCIWRTSLLLPFARSPKKKNCACLNFWCYYFLQILPGINFASNMSQSLKVVSLFSLHSYGTCCFMSNSFKNAKLRSSLTKTSVSCSLIASLFLRPPPEGCTVVASSSDCSVALSS